MTYRNTFYSKSNKLMERKIVKKLAMHTVYCLQEISGRRTWENCSLRGWHGTAVTCRRSDVWSTNLRRPYVIVIYTRSFFDAFVLRIRMFDWYFSLRTRVTETSRGLSGRWLGAHCGGGQGENFFEFSCKNAGFYAFLLRKTILVARNRDQGA